MTALISDKELSDFVKLFKNKDFEQCLNISNSWILKFPDDFRSWYYHGYLYHFDKKFDRAIKFYKKSISLNNKYIASYINLINVFTECNDNENAIVYIEEAIKFFPEESTLYFLSGNIYKNIDDINTSIDQYSKALLYDPNNAEAHNNIAIAYDQINKNEKAIEHFTIASKVLKNNEIMINLANSYKKIKNFKKSENLLNKIISKGEKTFRAYFNMYELIKLEKDKSIEALSVAKKMVDLFPNNIKSFICLLDSYLRLGDIKSSKEVIIKAVNIENTNATIASYSNYLSKLIDEDDIYPFCPNPMDYIMEFNLFDYFNDKEINLSLVIDYIKNKEQIWERSNKTVTKGYRASGSIFSEDMSLETKKVYTILLNIIKDYRNNFEKTNSLFISDFPDNNKIRSWATILESGGEHETHIHPGGWLSGVIYLEIDEKQDGGDIEFLSQGYDLPSSSSFSKTIKIKPNIGKVVLFPSSLFHSTTPNNSNTNRITIAFDLMANS